MKKRNILTALLLPGLAIAAQAQTYQVRNNRCFADVNGDRMEDYIVLTGDQSRPDINVYLSSGRQFSKTPITSSNPAQKAKIQGPAYFADVNGDGKADYVTLQGNIQTPSVVAYLCTGDGTYSAKYTQSSEPIDKGFDGLPRGFADINADGRADYLTFRGSYTQPHILAYLATKHGFTTKSYKSAAMLGVINPEANALRAFADVNADGMADYMDSDDGQHINIYPATRSQYNYHFIYPDKTSSSPAIDPGYENLPRGFVDVDGDKRADYVTFRGNEKSPRIYINYSYGSRFQEEPVKSSRVPRGIPDMIPAFADVNGDGKWDYISYSGTTANPVPVVYLSNGRDFIAPCVQETKVTLYNDAAYNAYFTLSYDLEGESKLYRSPLVQTNQLIEYTIPAGATNIEVVGYCNECYNKRRIFTDVIDRSDCPEDICYRVYGDQFKKYWDYKGCQ